MSEKSKIGLTGTGRIGRAGAAVGPAAKDGSIAVDPIA
jgi:phosphoglycerate dehydrogenase-like enzyme